MVVQISTLRSSVIERFLLIVFPVNYVQSSLIIVSLPKYHCLLFLLSFSDHLMFLPSFVLKFLLFEVLQIENLLFDDDPIESQFDTKLSLTEVKTL